jgi:hypothetical protein
MAVHLASLTSAALPWPRYGIAASPVISSPADAAQQRTQHVVRELFKPVNGKAEDALRLSALLPLRPCCPRRMLRLPGWPGIGMTLEREAEDPISLFLIAGQDPPPRLSVTLSEPFPSVDLTPRVRGQSWGDEKAQSLAWLIGPGRANAAPGAERLASGPGAAARVSGVGQHQAGSWIGRGLILAGSLGRIRGHCRPRTWPPSWTAVRMTMMALDADGGPS